MLISVVPAICGTDAVSAAAKLKKPVLTNHAASATSIKNTWKRVKGADGYEVYRSAKQKGKYKKVKTIKSGKTLSWTNKKLKKNKIYYYKVRAYDKVKGKKKYSKFSAASSAMATNKPDWRFYMSSKSQKTDKIRIEITNKSRYNMTFDKEGAFFEDMTNLEDLENLPEDATEEELNAAGVYTVTGKKTTIRPGKTAVMTFKAAQKVNYSKKSILANIFKYNKADYAMYSGWELDSDCEKL